MVEYSDGVVGSRPTQDRPARLVTKNRRQSETQVPRIPISKYDTKKNQVIFLVSNRCESVDLHAKQISKEEKIRFIFAYIRCEPITRRSYFSYLGVKH